MKWTILIALALPALACQVVDGSNILGKDVAAASPYFSALDPELVVGAAPMPGVQRIFQAAELVRLARQNAIVLPAPIGELCFERSTEPLTAETLLPILKTALQIDGASISILDFSRYGVPRGTLEFARAGLTPDGLWRGHLSYDETRSMPVWVKVRVLTDQSWLEATQPLPAGKIVHAETLVIRKGPRSPLGPEPLTSVDAAAGHLPLRAIRSGEAILASMLITPHEVERGDTVSVEVLSGEARIRFDAAADTAGRLGDTVTLRNPENGKPFQGRVEGRDKVVIQK